MRHVALVTAGLVLALAVALGANASAQGRGVGPLGIVPPQTGGAQPAAARGASGPNTGANLAYNGGPVMRTNTIYAIYWVPPGYSLPANYQTLVNRYFGDVAHDSHSSTNVYAATTQYFDTTGQIAYDSTFGGAALDTNTYPPSDCTMPSDVIGTTECLSDAAIQLQVKAFADSMGWPHGPNTEFFLFTPQNVGSCFDASLTETNNQCAYDIYCAYHWFFTAGSAEYIYANMPFPNQSVDFGSGVSASDCDSGEHPNGSGSAPSDQNAADEVLTITSHEHNESITDPTGEAWFTLSGAFAGDEDGDLCAWSWLAYNNGPSGVIGGSMSAGTAYNQVINGHHYFIQGEWSNASATNTDWSGCVWAFARPPINSASPSLSGTATVGQVLTASAGSWDGSPTTFAYTWLRCDGSGANCTSISTATTAAPSATYTLTASDDRHTIRVGVVASNSAGASPTATSAASAIVNGEPVNASPPAILGTARVRRMLIASRGTWSPAATTFTYTWERCASDGTACVVFNTGPVATHRVAAADVGHTLRVVVTAANAAGSSTAVESAATGPI